PLTEEGITRAAAAIRRLSPPGSIYLDRMEEAFKIVPPVVGPRAKAYKDAQVFTALQNVLRALRADYEDERVESPNRSDIPVFPQIEKLLTRFHLVAQRLKNRRANRPTFFINDEYDVQDLLYALLQIEFDDIRIEEPTPSTAGKSARMDF